MSNDQVSKSSSLSRKTSQTWLRKCIAPITSLSVRSRQTSESDPNRPVIVPRESNEMKRKRVPDNPVSRGPITRKMASHNGVKAEHEDPKVIFDRELEEAKSDIKYAEDRQALLKAEEDSAWDRTARLEASPDEQKAGKIIRAIREYERRVIFGNVASEAIPGPETRDMGGQFLTNKNHIETRSKLYEIAKMVPKGGLLHLHFNAELYPERLLEEARSMKNMFIRSIRPLITMEDLEVTEMVFNILPETHESVNIFSADYTGNATNHKDPVASKHIWMKWEEFRNIFNSNSEFNKGYKQPGWLVVETNEDKRTCCEQGKVELDAAENWLLGKMVLSEEEAYRSTQTVNGVWARFNQATRCFKGLLNYDKVYKWYIGQAIDRMIEEKVMYAELRPMLLDKSIPCEDGINKIDNAGQMRLIVEAVEAKQQQLKDEGRPDDFPFGLKIIYCTPRSIPLPMMIKEMKDCIDLKVQFPDLICGFDLVGAEDRPNHIGHYTSALLAFTRTCSALNISIPFLFHAGETLLDTGGSPSTNPQNSNLYDAYLLNSKRIGHGFSLMKHPQLVEKFKRKSDAEPGICVELCPISNELLHLCRNIKEHPFPELLAAGVPCCVNSDNPSLFSNSMSHEFYQIMVGAPTISIHSWKQLALWSLEYSCLNPHQKSEGRRIFLRKWEEFCGNVVAKYGTLLRGGEVDEEMLSGIYER